MLWMLDIMYSMWLWPKTHRVETAQPMILTIPHQYPRLFQRGGIDDERLDQGDGWQEKKQIVYLTIISNNVLADNVLCHIGGPFECGPLPGYWKSGQQARDWPAPAVCGTAQAKQMCTLLSQTRGPITYVCSLLEHEHPFRNAFVT